MHNFILLFFGINSILFVFGDYYDITTVYRFNTEEVYDNGEVITKYLNTCAVSVHPQTNAINLPFINLNNTKSDDTIHYPLSSPTVPSLNVPFNFKWKTLSSTGLTEDLQNDSHIIDHESLLNFMEEKVFITLLKKSKVLKEVSIESSHYAIDSAIELMKDMNKRRNLFLFLQINKKSIQGRVLILTMQKESGQYINIYIDCQNQIKVCTNGYQVCYTYSLTANEHNQALLYINLDGYPKIYDAIGHKVYQIHDINILDKFRDNYRFIYTDFHQSSKCGYFSANEIISCNIVQLPSAQVFPLEKTIVSSNIDVKNNSTIIVAFVRKFYSKLDIFIQELSTGYSMKLETKDLIEFNINQTDIKDAVVTDVYVRFPDNWTNEKQIYIKGNEQIYIINIWKGENLESYPIDKTKLCEKSNIKDIYGIIFREPMTNHTVTSCLNGGILDKSRNTCTCPPGFTGDICEIACGKNYFGQQCSQTCTNTDK